MAGTIQLASESPEGFQLSLDVRIRRRAFRMGSELTSEKSQLRGRDECVRFEIQPIESICYRAHRLAPPAISSDPQPPREKIAGPQSPAVPPPSWMSPGLSWRPGPERLGFRSPDFAQ